MNIAGYVSRKNLQSYRIGFDRHLHDIADPNSPHNRGRQEAYAGDEAASPEWIIIEKAEPMVRYLNRLGISNEEIAKVPSLPNCIKDYLGIPYEKEADENKLEAMLARSLLVSELSSDSNTELPTAIQEASTAIELSDELFGKKKK